jgi:hypothetical protein
VRVGERTLAVLLNEDGRKVLDLAALKLAESSFLWVYVEESDDLGLWARVNREDGDHLVLIRWEYVLAIDIPVGEPKSLGLR